MTDTPDLDKRLRDAVAFGGLPLTGRFEAAIAGVLDLHKPHPIDGDEPNGPQYCDACLGSDEDYLDYPCPTVRALADGLHVPLERAPEPRTWQLGDRAMHAGTPGVITFVGGGTVPWEFLPDKGEGFRFYDTGALANIPAEAAGGVR